MTAVLVRGAVRRFLDSAAVECGVVAVACSGGADSLALAEATVHCGRLGVYGLVVDHGLQPGSAAVAARAAEQLTALGCAKVQVLRVDVPGSANVEAAARTARYAALDAARPHPDALVLLGHTLDDQAETVLLGLGRGSGPRSIAGMRELDPPWGRPLLGVRRADTVAACASLGLAPWVDPHNTDPRFRRVRLRTEVLPLLEDVLAGGVAPALARTAAQLREDCDALDTLAAELLTRARAAVPTSAPTRAAAAPAPTAAPSPAPYGDAPPAPRGDDVTFPPLDGDDVTSSPNDDGASLDVAVLARAPVAVRRRAIRTWLLRGGVTDLTDGHLRAVDALVDPARWRGQGAVALPGGRRASRTAGRLMISHG